MVEHEEQIIRAADNLIDLGPGRGERGGAAPDQEWSELREEALPELCDLMERFQRSELDATQFRSGIDSFAKRHKWWGFRGTSLMFFTQLWKNLPGDRLAAAYSRRWSFRTLSMGLCPQGWLGRVAPAMPLRLPPLPA